MYTHPIRQASLIGLKGSDIGDRTAGGTTPAGKHFILANIPI
jgi:hypothetical protein